MIKKVLSVFTCIFLSFLFCNSCTLGDWTGSTITGGDQSNPFISNPPVPKIIGVSEGGSYTSEVIITTDVTGDDYEVKATMDESVFTLGQAWFVNGTHTLAITATNKKTRKYSSGSCSFSMDNGYPLVPQVYGVAEGGEYVTATINVVPQTGVTFDATLDTAAFTLGSSVDTTGGHRLVVTATRTLNGRTASRIINFIIDPAAPPVPVVSGVSEGLTYGTPVTINATPVFNVTHTATINGISYTPGTPYSNNGTKTVSVTATKPNGLTATKVISFIIDTVPPDPPVITGISDECYYTGTVTINALPASGVTFDATIDSTAYTLNTSYNTAGWHTLTVTAHKTSNKLNTTITLRFCINSSLDAQITSWLNGYVSIVNKSTVQQVHLGVDSAWPGWEDYDLGDPGYQNTFSPFRSSSVEVSYKLYTIIGTWGSTHGYTDLEPGEEGGVFNGYLFPDTHQTGTDKDDHPVTHVNWYSTVKWNNALSEYTGKTPCYYTDSGFTTVYKTGNTDTVYFKAANNGYRLPTEAEWEFLSRGQVAYRNYPYGEDADYIKANYNNSISGFGTKTVSSYDPYGFGIKNSAGNVQEWCYDWYADYPFSTNKTDYFRESGGTNRVIRGGDFMSWDGATLCSFRNYSQPIQSTFRIGFRPVCGQ